MRHLLAALRQPAHGARASLDRSAMQICADLLTDLNDIFSSTLDLYALQFLPCIWGKFLRHGLRLQEAAGKGSQELRRVHAAIKCSDRRRDVERILFLESHVLSEMLHGCEQRNLSKELHEYSAAVVSRVADRLNWSEGPSASIVLSLLKEERDAASPEQLEGDEKIIADACADAARHCSDIIRSRKRTPIWRDEQGSPVSCVWNPPKRRR